jgi:Not1 N-terminal domain, CCR4-Not complex component
MERFKACEKEMKTKAFSKEGLMASSKMDPREKERHEMGHFLMEMVEELGKQVEQAEAEQESLQIALKKGRKDPSKVERLGEVEHLVERHKWHQGRLELVLRLLENGNIQSEQVDSLLASGHLIGTRSRPSRMMSSTMSMKTRQSTLPRTKKSTMTSIYRKTKTCMPSATTTNPPSTPNPSTTTTP